MVRYLLVSMMFAVTMGCAGEGAVDPTERDAGSTEADARDGAAPDATTPEEDDDPEAPLPHRETLVEELQESEKTPDIMLVFGQDYEVRPAPSLEETRDALYGADGEPGPALAALIATGMDAERAVETVFAVAGHNSGQPYDPVRERAEEWRAAYQGAVETFNTEVAAAAEERGVTVDYAELVESGVVLGWEDVR